MINEGKKQRIKTNNKAKKIKSDNWTGSNREKCNIAMIVKKGEFDSTIIISLLGGTNNVSPKWLTARFIPDLRNKDENNIKRIITW